MLHIQEIADVLEFECRSAADTIKRLVSMPPKPMDRDLDAIVSKLDAFTIHFETLAQELKLRSADVTKVKMVVIEQMDTSRNFWNTVLAFLVALYVPLSFASVSIADVSRYHFAHADRF